MPKRSISDDGDIISKLGGILKIYERGMYELSGF